MHDTKHIEALKEMRLFYQRQVVSAQQQRAYARHRIPREAVSTNRRYYESEIERTTTREAQMKDKVEALDYALKHLGVDMDQPA